MHKKILWLLLILFAGSLELHCATVHVAPLTMAPNNEMSVLLTLGNHWNCLITQLILDQYDPLIDDKNRYETKIVSSIQSAAIDWLKIQTNSKYNEQNTYPHAIECIETKSDEFICFVPVDFIETSQLNTAESDFTWVSKTEIDSSDAYTKTIYSHLVGTTMISPTVINLLRENLTKISDKMTNLILAKRNKTIAGASDNELKKTHKKPQKP